MVIMLDDKTPYVKPKTPVPVVKSTTPTKSVSPYGPSGSKITYTPQQAKQIEQQVTLTQTIEPPVQQAIVQPSQPEPQKVIVTQKPTITTTPSIIELKQTIGVPLTPIEKVIAKVQPPPQPVVKPLPGPVTVQPKPTYTSVYKDINLTRTQVITSNLSPIEKSKILKELAVSERQIKQYEAEGFGVEKVKVLGELKPGEMGPPSPAEAYQFTVPEEAQLRWAKYQVKKSGELPPVLREITQFGQGLVSSGLSLVAPVAGLFGKQKEFDVAASIAMAHGKGPLDAKGFSEHVAGSLEAGKYGVHYPSTLDIAFEPIGMAPKGSTKFLSEQPAFAAGGVGGEVVQWIAGGEIIKGVSKGVGVGTRFIVPRISTKVVPVLSRTFGKPSLEVVQRVGGKLTTVVPKKSIPFVERLSQKQIIKNVLLYGKGYRPVAKGTESIVARGSVQETKGLTTISRISREFKAVPTKWHGFAERTFVPKESVKTFGKKVTVTNIARPGAIGRPAETTMLFEQAGLKKGLLSGIRRSYGSVKVTARGRLEPPIPVEIGEGPTKGSLKMIAGDINIIRPTGTRVSTKYGEIYKTFMVKSGKPVNIPMLESELAKAHPKVQWLYGTVIPSQKGYGIPSIARQVSKDLSKEASASLMGQPRTLTKLVSTSGKVVRGVSGATPILLPISRVVPIIGTVGIYGIGRGVAYRPSPLLVQPRPISVPIQKYKPIEKSYRPEVPPMTINLPVTEEETNRDLEHGVISIPTWRQRDERKSRQEQVEKQIPIERQDVYQRQLPREDFDRFTVQDSFQRYEQKTRLITPSISGGYGGRFRPAFPLGGGGEGYPVGGGGGGRLSPRKLYTERTFDIPTLESTKRSKPLAGGERVQFKTTFKPVVWRKPGKIESKIPRVL